MTDKELWNEASKLSCTIATNYKLLKQIEKMKNCMNCKNRKLIGGYFKCTKCCADYDKWECAE